MNDPFLANISIKVYQVHFQSTGLECLFFSARRAKLRLKASNSIWRYAKEKNLNITGLLWLHTLDAGAFSYIRFTKKARNDATDVLRSAFGRGLAIFTAIKLQTEWKKPFRRNRERFPVRDPVSAKERAPSSRVRVSSKTGGEQKDFRKYFRSTTQHGGRRNHRRRLLTRSTANVLAPFNPTSRNLQSQKGASLGERLVAWPKTLGQGKEKPGERRKVAVRLEAKKQPRYEEIGNSWNAPSVSLSFGEFNLFPPPPLPAPSEGYGNFFNRNPFFFSRNFAALFFCRSQANRYVNAARTDASPTCNLLSWRWFREKGCDDNKTFRIYNLDYLRRYF